MDKKNFLYAVMGILTLVISVVGATFAYYTAFRTGGSEISGNMASITFNLDVLKVTDVDEVNNRGLIPMTNAMVEKAVSNGSGNGICLDNNNNASCQIYKIVVNNTGSASMFFDGYVTLSGGSGNATDYESSPTTMRWAQVFCTEDASGGLASCTTKGKSTARGSTENLNASGIDIDWEQLGNGTGHSVDEIKDESDYSAVVTNSLIMGNNYSVISTNYIRVSKNSDSVYKQSDDVTSALVYNQYLDADDKIVGNNDGDSDDSYTDSQVYYIVVWLSETGNDQTVDTEGDEEAFFSGSVTFVSAQGSEVTGMFSNHAAVKADTE